jgi:L-fucose isomerase-like protein
MDPATTLHDVRWGEHYYGNGIDDFVWVLQISGAAPASHFIDGYRGAISERQPPMYFPLGGGTLKGIGRPGKIVWSRVFVEDNSLHIDLGLGSVIRLPEEETQRRWKQTTFQWPMVSAVFDGISRDSFMARHRANHVNIAYAPDEKSAANALAVKAAMFHALGVHVHLCGTINVS